jgi:hypothetical protein
MGKSIIFLSFKFFYESPYLGIGLAPIGDVKLAADLAKYSLYPKIMDQPGFSDTKIEDLIFKKTTSASIYFSDQYTDSGIRVMQSQCWRDLINLFSNPIIKAETVLVVKQKKADNMVTPVNVLGFLAL